MTLASSSEWNSSMASSSSRSLPLKDSTSALCQGDTGSMNTDPVELNLHQSAIALQVISGPLSIRMNTGCPRTATSRSRMRTRWSPVIDRFTSMTSAVLVNSSVTLRTFSTRPSAVWSNAKSNAHTWFGNCARSRSPGVVEVPTRARLRRETLTRRPSSRHRRCTRL